MMSTRFLVTCGVLAGSAVVLAIAGYFCGIPIVEWKMGMFDGKTQFVFRSPNEPAGIELATALMFAWPAISTIVAVAIYRWRRRSDAPPLVVVAYFTIPVAVLAGYIALRAHQMSELMASETGTRHPMIAILDLAPGTDEARLVMFVSICVWIFVGVRKPREPGPAGSKF